MAVAVFLGSKYSYLCSRTKIQFKNPVGKNDNKNIEPVRQKFSEYLAANHYRKTQERYAILDIIYSEQRHFDVDSLDEALVENNFRVSRATLYNTLQLLTDCNLVIKHQFGENISVYERAYNHDFHYHLICTSCRKIQVYKDENLQSVIRNAKIGSFKPAHYKLNIYGLCRACARKIKARNL
ncbi:MAG: transcriptional repressor [Dysgonamonadaceae bacterium]|jgi:Fur family ferric uptake transcriptional regulator|nr:transcriptional repressor [Dysgonamonadaceae bacterium]